MKTSETKGFTLVEILVVCGIVTVFLGTAIMLFTNFRRGFSRSESTAILMQESSIFLARLRTDLNNAVLTGSGGGQSIDQQLSATAQQLSFQVYSSQSGTTTPITYTYEPRDKGGSISRKEGSSGKKVLIKDHVASLSWEVQLEKFPTPGSGTLRLSIALDLKLKTETGKEKLYELATSIFPARLNRQLNQN